MPGRGEGFSHFTFQASPLPRPLSHLAIVGRWEDGRPFDRQSKVNMRPCGRPSSVLPSTGAPDTVERHCPWAAFHRHHTAPASRAGLGGSSPSGAPLRHQPGTGASLRYPVRTEFPWKRTRRISEVRKAGMKIFGVRTNSKGWRKKAENRSTGPGPCSTMAMGPCVSSVS